MKKSRFYASLAFLLFFLGQTVPAVQVNQEELESGGLNSDSVQFQSYGGPYSIIESADAIKGIGLSLGARTAEQGTEYAEIAVGEKYSVIHAVDPGQTEKLDSDIIIFGPDAGVDHIRNVRRILAGFLEAAYGYTAQDAETLAVFITVYNAVYRGNMGVFSERYKDIVIRNLRPESAGLSTNWQDWPGATQILIPLSGVEGAVETSVISDDNVMEALRQEEDKGVDVRENLADIKERESDDAAQNAKDAQRQAAEARRNGDNEAARENARVSSEQQNIADRKGMEAQNERREIEKDRELLNSGAEEKSSDYVTGLFVADEKKGLYTLITVNGKDGSVIRKSAVDTIVNPLVIQAGNSYVAVCSVKGKKDSLRLCLIQADTLTLTDQTEENLAEGTRLLFAQDRFYVAVQEDKSVYLAGYDKNLALRAKSSVQVLASSPLNFTPRGILVTAADGRPVMLSADTLLPVWQGSASPSAEK